MFGSTEPSSGLILRTDPYLFCGTFGIPNVYIDGVVITCAMLFFILFIYLFPGRYGVLQVGSWCTGC
jgi:hypothetical protein